MDRKRKRVARIVERLGGDREVARFLGITRQAVVHWRTVGRIPHHHALAIERLSQGKITARAILEIR